MRVGFEGDPNAGTVCFSDKKERTAISEVWEGDFDRRKLEAAHASI